MSYFCALLAALTFGAGDFLGGLAARREHWARVTQIAQAAGLIPLILATIVFGGRISLFDAAWSATAGVGFGIGVCLLYRALAAGQMGVVAPITALCAIMLPSLFAVATGHAPTAMAMLGIAASLPALVMISLDSSSASPTPGDSSTGSKPIGIAIIAGIGIAVFYICLKQTSLEGGLWPALVARVVSTLLCSAYVGVLQHAGKPFGVQKASPRLALAAGVLDGIANAFLLSAVRTGDLPTVATLSSLYPATTIVLAWVFLKERMNKLQTLGLCLAAFAAAAIVQSS